MLRSGDGIFLLSEKFHVVDHAGDVLFTVRHFDVVRESPGFGVKDGTFLLFVVVGRRVVDFEKSGEREETVIAQVEDVVLAGLTEENLLIVDVGVLVELGETFVEPERKPRVFAKHDVGVLVIDGGEGMLALGIETKEDVVLVGSREEESGEIELAFSEVGSGFESI
jgi:hypothetical protein